MQRIQIIIGTVRLTTVLCRKLPSVLVVATTTCVEFAKLNLSPASRWFARYVVRIRFWVTRTQLAFEWGWLFAKPITSSKSRPQHFSRLIGATCSFFLLLSRSTTQCLSAKSLQVFANWDRKLAQRQIDKRSNPTQGFFHFLGELVIFLLQKERPFESLEYWTRHYLVQKSLIFLVFSIQSLSVRSTCAGHPSHLHASHSSVSIDECCDNRR